jgi:hypothetical protein
VIGPGSIVTERCITSQGIICPPTYTTASQLPCPNEVIHRVEERVAAATGTPVFPVSGVIGLNGISVSNKAQINGNVTTNLQLGLTQQAQVTSSANLAPGASYPIIQNSASLGASLQCNSANATLYSSTNTWPSGPTGCITRASAAFTLLNNPPPYPENTDNSRVANGLAACALSNTCPHDTFTNGSGPCTTLVNSNPCATWDATHRLLTIPNGVTWTISGGNYNFCSLALTGSGQAVLANGVKTAIFIDSPQNPSPSPVSGACTSTGQLNVGSQAQLVNNSPPLPGSPLAHDTTALQIWVYGPSLVAPALATWNSNSCQIGGSNTTDASCVQLGQGTAFYGTLYAPTSDVKITNSSNTYGGIAARAVAFANPGQFFQDANIPSLVTTATLAIYYRTAWTECQAAATVSSNPMSGC